jgi:hypothetical protein
MRFDPIASYHCEREDSLRCHEKVELGPRSFEYSVILDCKACHQQQIVREVLRSLWRATRIRLLL